MCVCVYGAAGSVEEAGLRWRICVPELSLQPENNHPAFCLGADVAVTNTLKLHRLRHTDGATMEPVCQRLCVNACVSSRS